MVSHVRSLSPPPGQQKAEEKPLGFGADAYMLTHLTSTREPRTVGPAERHRLVYYETGAPRSPHATADTSAISPKKPDYASWGHTRAETASSAPFSTSPSKAPRSSTFTLDKVESVAASEEKATASTTTSAPAPAPAATTVLSEEGEATNALAPDPPPQESWVDSAMAAEEAAQQASLAALARMKANDDAALGEALPLLEECLNKLRTQTSASHHPLVIELMETYASMLYAKGDDEAANAVVREIACKRLVKDVVSNVGEGRVGVAKQQAVEEVPQKSGWLWW